MGGSYQSAAEGLSAGSPSGASSGAPTPGVFAGGARPPARPGSPGALVSGALSAPAPAKPALSEPAPSEAAHSGPGGPKPDPAPAAPTLDSARPDQMAAIRARKAEQEREQAARDKAARARKAAAEQAAERQREDRLKAMARRRADQTAARQTAARQTAARLSTSAQAAESTRLLPQGATVDDRIRSLMRDRRYWKDRDPGLLDHVTRQWARAYPGASLHTGFKRPDPQPAIRPEAVEPWPPILEAPQRPLGLARPGMLPPHPTPAVHKPGWTWNGWTGEWERMTPEEAADEQAWLERGPTPLKADAPAPATHAPTLGHNSGLTREDALDALREKAADGSMSPSAFLKEAERIRQAHPDDGADGVRVQVAAADLDRVDLSGGDRSAGETTAPPAGETRKERRDKRSRMEPQSSIPLNSLKYERMHEILQGEEGAVRSQWFGAAADVTSLDSLGALDSPAGELVDARAGDVMRAVHHKLAPENFALFERLRTGELPDDLKGLSGKELDYALVEREQALVQQHLDAELGKLPEAERAEVTEALSRLINPDGLRRFATELFGDGAVIGAFDAAFPNGQFDFSQQSHREKLGKVMIDFRYESMR